MNTYEAEKRLKSEKFIAEITKKRSREKQLYSSIDGVQKIRKLNETKRRSTDDSIIARRF